MNYCRPSELNGVVKMDYSEHLDLLILRSFVVWLVVQFDDTVRTQQIELKSFASCLGSTRTFEGTNQNLPVGFVRSFSWGCVLFGCVGYGQKSLFFLVDVQSSL